MDNVEVLLLPLMLMNANSGTFSLKCCNRVVTNLSVSQNQLEKELPTLLLLPKDSLLSYIPVQYTINRTVLKSHSSFLHKQVMSGKMEGQGMSVFLPSDTLFFVTEFPQTIFSLC